MGKFIIIVLDGFGAGQMADVPQVRPADLGANTCVHIFEHTPDLKLPTSRKAWEFPQRKPPKFWTRPGTLSPNNR